MIPAIVIAICAFLNRFAGGGWPGHLWDRDRPGKLWGRALYPAIAMTGLIALIVHPWPVALAFAAAFGFWRSFSWGALIGLGRPSGADHREHNPVEATLLAWFGPHGGLFARHLFALPGILAIGWIAGIWWAWIAGIAFAALATMAYELSWRLTPRMPLTTAEIAVGALWGALIVII